MSDIATGQNPLKNYILASLPELEFKLLKPVLERVSLKLGDAYLRVRR